MTALRCARSPRPPAFPVALVSYHFESKDGLYRAVFYRRVPTIVEQRLAGLAIAMSEADLDRRLELIVKALVMPMLRLRARDKDPSWGRLLAHETTDPNSEARGIIRDLIDPIAHKLMEALRLRCPTGRRGISAGPISSCSARWCS